ncbi:MAG: lipopolysaccharide transport periplasmic protein LptA [Proteobacteria bacterium]|nr:lipopolysaccharide transport periplasmic protein LptA [Pseudomonadota bacterium]
MYQKMHIKNLNRIILWVWTTFFSVGAFALETDRLAVMHVVSDTATYDRNQHTITYQGNVQVEQGSSHLDGDKIVIYQSPTNNNQIEKIIAYGQPAHYNTLPQPNNDRMYVEALVITYDPLKKIVTLEGKGRVNQGGNIFSGPHIWYDMINGVVHSSPGQGKERTEMIIQPHQFNSHP